MGAAKELGFVAVGSEMLRGGRVETNSHRVFALLAPLGYRLRESRCVADEVADIAGAIAALAARMPLVVVSGGLGPTADDVTREALAQVVNRPLVEDPALVARLRGRYGRLGREMPPLARRMAQVIPGAEVLDNPEGTAPGLLLPVGDATVVALPGVPEELETILRLHLVPRWRGDHPVVVRTLHLAGVYESEVEGRIAPLYEEFGREAVTILAGRGQVDLVLSASGPGATDRMAAMVSAFGAAAGEDLFGVDEETLEGEVLELLGGRGWRLATAESCTGGLVGGRLTSVPGASRVYLGGVVAYDNRWKTSRLGVSEETMAAHGAVSEAAARAMARGARDLGAECAVSVTGIAGPGGATADKPLGTVHIAVVTPALERHGAYRFLGNRDRVRGFAATFALDLLRRAVWEEG